MVDHSADYLTTKELASLLRVKARKVYALAAAGEIPCSRATGKLLFPRAAVDAWVAQRSSGIHTGAMSSAAVVRPQVFLGSHDPLLEWVLRESRSGLASYFDGSLDGLERFIAGAGIAAGMHILDPQTGKWNEPCVTGHPEVRDAVLVEWAWRARGLLTSPDVASAITCLQDLPGHRVIPRQPAAGSQGLFEHLLETNRIGTQSITFLPPARTEFEAGVAVLEGKADVAFGLQALADQYGLAFVPVLMERFDLLVDRRAWFEPPMQKMLSFCRSEAFHTKLGQLKGYDAQGLGTVHFNSP